ncbi:MAG: hypothetical protein JXA42_23645 [Anaerolineales bacterium]|nr:hypothetical protein [Anaerolineales bacterium]
MLIELLRQAPPWRKLQMVGQLNHTVRTLALSGLRQRYHQATQQELDRRLVDLLLGPDLAARAYGPLKVRKSSDGVCAYYDLAGLLEKTLAQANGGINGFSV